MSPYPHPADLCCCGDYRRQHVGGLGACTLGSLCTPHPCKQFRLNRRAPVVRWHRCRWYNPTTVSSGPLLLGPFDTIADAAGLTDFAISA